MKKKKKKKKKPDKSSTESEGSILKDFPCFKARFISAELLHSASLLNSLMLPLASASFVVRRRCCEEKNYHG